MPKYTADECRKAMDDITNVRNVVMMGSMGHGKSVTMDNFGAKEGYLAENKIGEALFTLYRQDERERKVRDLLCICCCISKNLDMHRHCRRCFPCIQCSERLDSGHSETEGVPSDA